MAKIQVVLDIDVNDEELERNNVKPEEFAASLTTFGWDFASPGIVICQDVDNEEYTEKIVNQFGWKIEKSEVISGNEKE